MDIVFIEVAHQGHGNSQIVNIGDPGAVIQGSLLPQAANFDLTNGCIHTSIIDQEVIGYVRPAMLLLVQGAIIFHISGVPGRMVDDDKAPSHFTPHVVAQQIEKKDGDGQNDVL